MRTTESHEKGLRPKGLHDRGLRGLLRRRLIGAPIYAWRGLQACFKTEEAFRLQLLAAAIMVPLAFWLDISTVEKVLLILPIVLVLIVELLNTAVETVVDRIGRELHDLSAKAKDIASSAVLISLLTVVLVWALILTPHILVWKDALAQ
ncbi:MAG: diacylglycerol kinase [Pseudohongiella sp.]|nr:diacylglycerol kinase [Pseudohongiella sp.]